MLRGWIHGLEARESLAQPFDVLWRVEQRESGPFSFITRGKSAVFSFIFHLFVMYRDIGNDVLYYECV